MSTRSTRPYRVILLAGIAVTATLVTAQPSLAQAPATRTPAQRTAPAPSARSKAVRVASVEGITQYDLPNGMRVLLFPDQSKPSVTVNITYLVGSRHEGSGETGMAHFLEHLVFKGTPKHRDIPQELSEHGAQANGTTWYDRTNYYVTVPATDANLMWALDLESDRMVNSFIAKKDLESEMTVVRNEFESGENNPNSVLFQRTLSTAYLWHGYGRSTIGSRADLEGVKVDRLQAFYRKYYQPDNAILVVAGKFDEPKTLAMVERMFGRIPRPARRLEPTYTAEPTQDGERTVTLRRVGDVQLVNAVYHVPAGSHADLAALDVLTHVLGNAPSGRLYKALVESKKAASVGSFAFQLAEPGVLMAFAQVRSENSLDSARTILLETLEKTSPASAEDVERGKAALLKNIELTLNSSENVGLELTEWASMGDWRLFFIHRDRIKKVTPADVDRVAAAYLKPSNRTLGLFHPTAKPDRAEIPVASDVQFLVRDYKGDTAAIAGEAFDASFVNLDARTVRSSLPNGMRLTMVPKKTRGGSVFSRVYLRFGSMEALTGRTRVSALTAQMLDKGTTTRTRQQIKDELDKLKARVSFSGQNISSQATIETTRGNLPAVLRLVAEMMQRPAFDAKEFEQLKTQALAGLETNKSEPGPLAGAAYGRHMNPRPKGHPLYTATLEEQIAEVKAVTLDQVKQFHAELYGADNGDITIVGDVDQAEATKVATELYGSWKSSKPFERLANSYRDVAPTTIVIETPDKTNAIFIAGLNVNMRDDHADWPAVELANYMLGGGFLSSRLGTRIRQKEGISYGVGSQFQAHPIDDAGTFMSFAIYAPQNVARLEAAFKEEIEKALKDGFTADELEKAKTGYFQASQLARSEDSQLANTLVSQGFFKRTFARDAEVERKIAALTPVQIVEAMRRHIDPKKITIVKAGDFANKKPAAPTP